MIKNKNADILSKLDKIDQKKGIRIQESVIQKVKQLKKMGRPTWKDANIHYVRVSADIPIETRNAIKMALYDSLKDKFLSQDELINVAIREFLERNKK